MSSSDDDSQQRFALGFLFALIALVVATVVGVVVFKRGIAHAPTAPKAGVVQAVEAAAPGVAVVEEASVVVEGGVVKFYFAVGKADLATGAKQALADVIKGVLQGKKAVVSGFHDATGDLAVNQELAKQRAFAVRDALLSLGITEEGIELKKPEQTLADGSDAEARRVEVTLAP
ncbi:OmpA family protein [Paenacidovorax caeni]|jgi:outer membrane protein OmpA-like peptidoglycan-associated protein|uniref:OmpA family protein n=1 Tax=Paenacidovorax caeni TaxID=343013 RepID=A0A1I7JW78_9BURK|nr:OmpA family protein [Paenacidovorax caeni]SFU89450.1 OmpA family protein [Paenacidovorax caeni]